MNPISAINELQQQNKLPMVTIEVKRFGGPDHMPEWGAFAHINGRAFASRKSNYTKKGDAKQDCAQVIYDELRLKNMQTSSTPDMNVKVKSVEPMKPVTPIKTSSGVNYYIWVDLDNSRHIWNGIIESGIPVKLLRGYGGPRLETSSLPSISGLSRVETTRTNMKDSADYALFADVLLYIDAKVKSPEPFVAKDMILIVSGDASLETACFILKDRYNTIDIRYIAKLSDLF